MEDDPAQRKNSNRVDSMPLPVLSCEIGLGGLAVRHPLVRKCKEGGNYGETECEPIRACLAAFDCLKC